MAAVRRSASRGSTYRPQIKVTWEPAPPDQTLAPLAAHLLDTWAASIQTDKPTALGTPLRNSDAGRCSRSIAYKLSGTPETDPTDVAGFWRMQTGTDAHERWQRMLATRGDVQTEVPVRTPGCEGSGHIDAVLLDQYGYVTEVDELKTVNRLKFEHSIGWVNNREATAKGPDFGHIAQGALNAAAVQAQQPDGPDVVLTIVFFSMESLSPKSGDRIFGKGHAPWRRFMASWTFVRDQWEPIAEAEAARMQGVLEDVRAGRDVVPFAPVGAGDKPFVALSDWRCSYCSFVSQCRADLSAAGAA